MKTMKSFGAALLATFAGAIGLAPPALAAPANSSFHPLSVTFVSLDTGWALGTVPCKGAGACLSLVKTTDAGHSWTAEPLPGKLVAAAGRTVTNGVPKGSAGFVRLPAALYGAGYGYGLGVRFADPEDGWIYGSLPLSASSEQPVLWSTHDGGATWHQLSVGATAPYSLILDLEAAGGSAYMMVVGQGGSYSVSVESTPVSSDNWRPDSTPRLSLPAGGAQLQGAIVLQSGRGWLVEGNDRGVTGSAQLAGNGKWERWAPPCAAVGNTYVVPAASSASRLVAACQMGGYAYPLSKSAPPGATLGSWWLYFSSDGGQSFVAGPRLGSNGYQFTGLLASPAPGVVFLGYGGYGGPGGAQPQLLASFDGGRTWAPAYRGSFFYLGFTSPSQGVGLLRPSPSTVATTEMVMTFDAGRHWARARF
jgi:photosystem II stability/assembly factor-like uncharacterized protein